jgi:glycosyltransferase involved in cell wall biosynthesis
MTYLMTSFFLNKKADNLYQSRSDGFFMMRDESVGEMSMAEILRVSMIGEDFWCQNLEKQLKRENVKAEVLKKTPANPLKRIGWRFYFQRKITNTHILHLISPYGAIKTLRVARRYETPIVCHWIGSDVTKLDDPKKKSLFFAACPPDAVHLAVSKHIAEELANHGIKAFDVVPNLTDRVLAEPEPLPDKPAVLLYWSDKRALFFNAPMMFKLAKSIPGVSFYVLGAEWQDENAPPNVKFLGFQEDVQKYIRLCTAYIRWTPHDGQPVLVAESLAMGRYVIFNHKAPYCEFADSYEKTYTLLMEIFKRCQPNYEGARFVHDTLDPQSNIEKLISIYEKISYLPRYSAKRLAIKDLFKEKHHHEDIYSSVSAAQRGPNV